MERLEYENTDIERVQIHKPIRKRKLGFGRLSL